MKRSALVEKLIEEGFSEKTLVNFNDKQLSDLHERIITTTQAMAVNPEIKKLADDPNTDVEVKEELKGDIDESLYGIMIGATKEKLKKSLGRDAEDHEVEKELDRFLNSWKKDEESKKVKVQKKKEVDEELKGGQKKLDKNHNGKIDGQDFKILKGQKKEVKEGEMCEKCKCEKSKCECKKSDVKEWVEKLVENKYHSFTSKNEIMELIKVKITENKGEPSKPDRDAPVREKPTTKPDKPKRENPFEPKHTPKPKALGEDGDTKTTPVKPKVKPSTKPKRENPFEPKHTPKPKALGEDGEKKNKMPEFMKFKNLGFKFKDQN